MARDLSRCATDWWEDCRLKRASMLSQNHTGYDIKWVSVCMQTLALYAEAAGQVDLGVKNHTSKRQVALSLEDNGGAVQKIQRERLVAG